MLNGPINAEAFKTYVLKGSAARRSNRRRMAKRKEFRHQSHCAAISGQAPHFGKKALVFWRATIRHDLSHRADNSTRGNPQRQALKRGASTCTAPNNVVNWRVRQSLMARREPQCEHFRR